MASMHSPELDCFNYRNVMYPLTVVNTGWAPEAGAALMDSWNVHVFGTE